MNRKLILSVTIGFLLSAAAFFLAFKNVPFAELWHYMKSVNYLWIIPAVLVSLTSFLIRIIRWRILLRSVSTVPFSSLYHIMTTGFMLNCVLPGRIGEIARPAILARNERVPFSTGLATIVTERTFDLLSLVCLFTLFLSTIEIDPAFEITTAGYRLSGETLESVFKGMVFAGCFFVTGLILISMKGPRSFLTNLILRLPDGLIVLSPTSRSQLKSFLSPFLVNLADNVSNGIKGLKSPSVLATCLVLSFCIWMIQAYSYYLLTFACPGLSLSYTETASVMIIICFVVALPSVPGFWGLWEAGGIFALTLFSVARETAAGYTLINHTVQIIPVIIIGMISAVILGINVRQYYKPEPEITAHDS